MSKYNPSRNNRFASLTRDLPPAKRRMLQRNLMFVTLTLSLIGLLTLVAKANAAGGAYGVDDGAINAPGECNLDLWYQSLRHQGSNHGAVFSPACTFAGLPWLQVGAALERSREDGHGETQLSPQLKAQLWNREDLGLQLALATSAHFALNRGHAFDGGDISLPLTYQPLQSLRLNFNAGWAHAYDDGQQNHRWTWGSGFEYDLGERLTLVAERYGQRGGEQAWQAGPRLHLGANLDLDLVLGGQLNEGRDRWLTSGATLRF
ncbi:hypothetical protein [Pseudomonas chlororaphis]|uniref:Uncharacterized protein n=1 Tax=Pseudomonas chlororaphis subsp. aurantiaca TaxID=86192 RepID=A0AAJ0ZGM7_9PSED|nr:hypothetical protein [Pseudomonas chlororaphis]MBU4631995.1 hypothetical protein [Pseudomonas chlororaphis subsp. aurantiaca]